jgi:hypothetical protein
MGIGEAFADGPAGRGYALLLDEAPSSFNERILCLRAPVLRNVGNDVTVNALAAGVMSPRHAIRGPCRAS